MIERRRGVLALGEAEVDVLAFESAARSGDEEAAHALYHGPFLEGLGAGLGPEFEEWADHRRTRLRELRREVLCQLARQSPPNEAVELWLARLADDPLGETACRMAMEAYLQMERPAQALKLYHQHADFLDRELGLPPETETRALAEFIRSGRPKQPARGLRFAGRDLELLRLEAAYAEQKGVFISGEPGIGKTRLALEFARTKGLEPFWLRGRPGDAEVPYAALGSVGNLAEEETIEPRLRAEARYIRASPCRRAASTNRPWPTCWAPWTCTPTPTGSFTAGPTTPRPSAGWPGGDPERAAAHNRTAAAHFRRWDDLAGEANTRRVDAEIAAAVGNADEAERGFMEALTLARRSGHQGVLGYVLASALLFFERAGHGERVRALAREGHALEGPYRALFARRLPD